MTKIITLQGEGNVSICVFQEELYHEECGPDNPLRCYVGDISGRLGTISLGDKRQVFTDSNFPLGQ